MERPDLHELSRHARALAEAVNDDLLAALDAGYSAALGDYDVDTDTELDPGSGDEPLLFEKAKTKAADARFALTEIVDLLATQQGLRDFADSGAVEA